MKSTAAKNKQSTSFADLVADSELKEKVVRLGDWSVTVRELTGRERFSLSERKESEAWDTTLFVASTGLVNPKVEKPEDLDAIRTEWVMLIANSILSLSGMDPADSVEAGKESADAIDIGGS